ncbi:hypothetical protein [Polaromonas sp. YR568]|uniref:hypothetical protein n=1 Tax=Polaromonas sp. YR568 TaxID=1855301 RepID=UPI00398BBED5
MPEELTQGEPKSAADPADFSVHKQLVFWLFAATFILVAATAFILITAGSSGPGVGEVKIAPVVVIAGTLGAFVSALRRIYSFENIFPSKEYQSFLKGANIYVIAYSSIPPLVGAIAAIVMYLVFSSRMFQSELTPLFVCEIERCANFMDFLDHWKPDKPSDYAKAIVWGFIAGFSERFVPDILNRFSTSTGKKSDA